MMAIHDATIIEGNRLRIIEGTEIFEFRLLISWLLKYSTKDKMLSEKKTVDIKNKIIPAIEISEITSPIFFWYSLLISLT